MKIGDECPECGSILGIEELDWGCFCCGGHSDIDDDSDYDDVLDDIRDGTLIPLKDNSDNH